jgi:hypothetical protein
VSLRRPDDGSLGRRFACAAGEFGDGLIGSGLGGEAIAKVGEGAGVDDVEQRLGLAVHVAKAAAEGPLSSREFITESVPAREAQQPEEPSQLRAHTRVISMARAPSASFSGK